MDTNINIRTNKEIKNATEQIFKDLGINMSIAINMFLNECVRVNGLPLQMRLNKVSESSLKEAHKLYKKEMKAREKGKHLKGIISDDETLKKSLDV